MKNFGKYAWLWMSLWCAPLFSAAQPAAAPAADSAEMPVEFSLLYRISGPGLDRPSYLFGTIHIIPDDDFFLTENTKKAFESAERVVFEIDMEEMMDLGTQLTLMSKAMMDGGLTLRDLLDEADYALVKAHFEKMGLPLFLFERFKPMFLTIFATTDMEGGSPFAAQAGMVSYEMVLMDMARQAGKEIDGLETAAYQMSLFDSIPYSEQAKMLVESIRQLEADTAQHKGLEQLYQWYKEGNIERLQQAIATDEQGLGPYEELLLIRRNENWIPVMERMMREGPTFFAVGAGHLGGPKGVVNLLRRAGYELTPLPMK